MSKRLLSSLCALACAGLAPASAQAAVHGQLTGKITYIGATTLTVQTGGARIGVANALVRTANRVAAGNYPYVWAGGHAQAGVASLGSRGPGYTGRRRGFDCSGSVAAVLSGAGLWPAGAGVPGDYGVIQQLRAEHLIARGPGRAPNAVNLYDHPGVHIFMSINGRFFGTSDGGGGNGKGGPTWLDDGAPDSYSRAYHRWHFLPSVLRNRTSYGHNYAFLTTADPALVYGAELGEKVTVGYLQRGTGAMAATALSYFGASTAAGTVTALSGDTMTIQESSGPTLTFATALVSQLLAGIQVGDGVQVSYSTDPSGQLVPHALQVTSAPAPADPGSPGGSPGDYPGQPPYSG